MKIFTDEFKMLNDNDSIVQDMKDKYGGLGNEEKIKNAISKSSNCYLFLGLFKLDNGWKDHGWYFVDERGLEDAVDKILNNRIELHGELVEFTEWLPLDSYKYDKVKDCEDIFGRVQDIS